MVEAAGSTVAIADGSSTLSKAQGSLECQKDYPTLFSSALRSMKCKRLDDRSLSESSEGRLLRTSLLKLHQSLVLSEQHGHYERYLLHR
jgi:hypothetical protein